MTILWRRLRPWVVGAVACTLIAALLASQWFFDPRRAGGPHASDERDPSAWPQILFHYALICYIWGILSYGIAAVTTRVGLDRRRWIRALLIYLFAGVAFSTIHTLASYGMLHLLALIWSGNETSMPLTVLRLLSTLPSNLIIFTVITSVALAVNYYRKFLDRELRATKLESQLTLAQLNALKTQIQPHFLFNTLNAIAALVREQPPAAERMLIRLSDLLRATLDKVDCEEVSVRDELDFIDRYVGIEQVRFGDRLIFEKRVEPGVARALLPTLILQTLVENAMRHGVARVAGECRVTVEAGREGSKLCLQVLDTGPGTHRDNDGHGRGSGIACAKDRLRHLYGVDSRFEAGDRPGGGFQARIEIPYHEVALDETPNGARS